MPGFVITLAALDRVAQNRNADIAIRYIPGSIAPIGSVFAATPRDVINVLRKAGMQPFHSGKFTVSGNPPADVMAAFSASNRNLFAATVVAPSSDYGIGARASTTGGNVVLPGSNSPVMPHEATHTVQQRSGR